MFLVGNNMFSYSKIGHLGARHRRFFVGGVTTTRMNFSASSGGNDMKFKAVIFDAGGVMMPSPLQEMRAIEKRFNLQPFAFGRRLAFSKQFADLETGKLDLEEFVDSSKHIFQDMIPAEQFRDVIYNIFGSLPRRDERFDVVGDAVKSLRADGFRTALLTNNWLISRSSTGDHLPLDRNSFDKVVESCRVGIRKPDPAIFELVLRELSVSPNESIFIDDLGQNLKTAKALGIHTIKAESPQQVVDDLENLLNLSLRRFVPGTVSPAKHLRLPADKVAEYLKSIIPNLEVGDGEKPAIRQFVNGRSNPTYFISYGNRDLVLRRKPPGKLLPSAHLIDREYKLFSALSKPQSGVAVPKMVSYCSDASVVGSEFFVMDYVPGVIYKDLSLRSVAEADRKKRLYSEMNKVLAAIHKVDVDAVGLGDWGKRENYLERNLSRWVRQYESAKTSEHASMNELIDWLKENSSKYASSGRVSLVHGDFRLDNLLFDKKTDRVLGVLDWELSTLGDPLTDLATSVFHYFVPSVFKVFSGISDAGSSVMGLPGVQDHVAEYFRFAGVSPPADDFLNFYVAFVAFRYAAIAQGVYKRAITGQSASPGSEQFGEAVPVLAKLALKLAKSGEKGQKTVGKPSSAGFPTSPSDLGPKAGAIYAQLEAFIYEKLAPIEQKMLEFYGNLPQGEGRWSAVCPELEKLKLQAKQQGLWNLWLCQDLDPKNRFGGAGLTNVEYAFMSELMGRYQPFGPEVFNCAAPDTGNMEVLIRYGNEAQQQRWLGRLLSGEIRSAFAMTEPAVASSDATNICSSIRRENDTIVVNGRKWWTSGILNPKCEVIIFLGKSDACVAANAPIHRQHSMLVFPRHSPGVQVVRPLLVFGFDDNVHGGHGEVDFDDVRVPASEAVLLEEGRGFEMGQGRLGPGRIHHCMRLIGMAARAIDLSIERAHSRTAFFRTLAERDAVREGVARSFTELEQARLLVLKTAHLIDTIGAKKARREIAMIKAVVPVTVQTIVDRAIQVHGGAGVSQDFPLAGFLAAARALRIADGPDEVHWRTIGRMMFKPPKL